MKKFGTDPVAIFKLLCVFSWSPSSDKFYYTLKGYYIKSNIEKQVSLVYVVQIFWDLALVNLKGLL